MKPVLQALVLADHVYTDISGKKIICGTFSRVLFVTKEDLAKEVDLPSGEKQQVVRGGMHSGSPYAFISITDVVDDTELTLQFVNLTKNHVLFGQTLRIQCKNRLETIEIIAPLPPLPIEEAGVYAFEVVCEGDILGSHRITGEQLPDTQGDAHGNSGNEQ